MEGNSNSLVLPDSRLGNETLGSVMVDWPLPDGRTVRCEAILIYCANCGKRYGYVPKDNISFAFYLCRKCEPAWSALAGTYSVPDEQFDRAVAYEMQEKFGHALTDDEILYHLERHELGTALEKLSRESPYPVPTKPGEV